MLALRDRTRGMSVNKWRRLMTASKCLEAWEHVAALKPSQSIWWEGQWRLESTQGQALGEGFWAQDYHGKETVLILKFLWKSQKDFYYEIVNREHTHTQINVAGSFLSGCQWFWPPGVHTCAKSLPPECGLDLLLASNEKNTAEVIGCPFPDSFIKTGFLLAHLFGFLLLTLKPAALMWTAPWRPMSWGTRAAFDLELSRISGPQSNYSWGTECCWQSYAWTWKQILDCSPSWYSAASESPCDAGLRSTETGIFVIRLEEICCAVIDKKKKCKNQLTHQLPEEIEYLFLKASCTLFSIPSNPTSFLPLEVNTTQNFC